MCTVTYLPTGKNSFILTSNRDEHILRPVAIPPIDYSHGQMTLTYPKDPTGGGTWIALKKNNTVVCLLNGAFLPHVRLHEYRVSRGLVVLDYFKYAGPDEFASNYNFEGIEPFTLIAVSTTDVLDIRELRWDGNCIHVSKKDAAKPAIWSSCTLYDTTAVERRQRWFAEWLESGKHLEVSDIKEFHQSTGLEDAMHGLIISRDNGIKTVAITSVYCSSTKSEIHHSDIVNDLHYRHQA